MLKSLIQKSFVIFILITSLISPIFAAEDYQAENQPQVLEKVFQFE
jgi:hypothetical protein